MNQLCPKNQKFLRFQHYLKCLKYQLNRLYQQCLKNLRYLLYLKNRLFLKYHYQRYLMCLLNLKYLKYQMNRLYLKYLKNHWFHLNLMFLKNLRYLMYHFQKYLKNQQCLKNH
jgi:hypothetical protein